MTDKPQPGSLWREFLLWLCWITFGAIAGAVVGFGVVAIWFRWVDTDLAFSEGAIEMMAFVGFGAGVGALIGLICAARLSVRPRRDAA